MTRSGGSPRGVCASCWSGGTKPVPPSRRWGATSRPASAAQFVFDACTHEHDIRGALGRPGGRGSDSVHVGLAFIAGALDGLVTEGRLPGVELDSPDFHAVLGEPPVPVRLSAPTFELFRSFGGRRSPAQFRSLAWEGDPAPFLAFFAGGPIRPPDEDLVE